MSEIHILFTFSQFEALLTCTDIVEDPAVLLATTPYFRFSVHLSYVQL